MFRDLIPFTPYAVSTAFDEVEHLLNQFAGANVPTVRFGYPAVDVREESDKYIVEVELPGMTEKDIEVKLADRVLTLSSKKDEGKQEKRNGYLLRERRTTSFRRSFTLPRDIDSERIVATFKNGLLSVELAKKAEAAEKNVTIMGA